MKTSEKKKRISFTVTERGRFEGGRYTMGVGFDSDNCGCDCECDSDCQCDCGCGCNCDCAGDCGQD
jgi:hypothetical protein